jgi:prevent-host-death family protein
MIVNVRESKARLSELVTKAAAGEEILITVRGQPKARLVAVSSHPERPDLHAWAEELEARLASQPAQSAGDSSTEILDELRQERF